MDTPPADGLKLLELVLQFLIVPAIIMLYNINNRIFNLEIKMYREFVRRKEYEKEHEREE